MPNGTKELQVHTNPVQFTCPDCHMTLMEQTMGVEVDVSSVLIRPNQGAQASGKVLWQVRRCYWCGHRTGFLPDEKGESLDEAYVIHGDSSAIASAPEREVSSDEHSG